MRRNRAIAISLACVGFFLLAGVACRSESEKYVIVKYERRPTIVFKAYSDADTDAYLIKHGRTIIKAECGHEAHASWNPSDPIYFHCLLPVDKPLSLIPVPGFAGRSGLRYSGDGETIDLVIVSEEVVQ
jgi:hypothetical protein